ncbi:hypothetical protein LCGC14_1454800 [marine sediment metagenome]|uniref:ISXO2-like transposase domain-containing protein n=1 Tax=marine sediment metagenome TaxID=412755 RepID=A0A0F9JHH5_9ZZZZ
MPKKFKGLIDFIEKFPDEKTCRKFLAKMRWDGKPVCPFKDCKHDKVYVYNDEKKYKCAKCRRIFSVRVGTIFEDSKISLQKWFMAFYLTTAHKKGISSLQLGRDLNITQKSAWFMLHRIRETTRDKAPEILEGVVEIDEVFIGGKESNKHKHLRTGSAQENKTPVIGLLQRGKEVRTKVLKNVQARQLIPPILHNVKPGSYIVTDQNSTYKRLQGYYVHVTINHDRGEYARDAAHVNTLEGFWSHLKRMITGIYHQISEKHTHRYCDAMSFRYNTRHLTDVERFYLAISRCEGRLRYKELIKDQA